MSLVILGNGHTAINFEHSWGDGGTISRGFHEILHHMVGTYRARFERAFLHDIAWIRRTVAECCIDVAAGTPSGFPDTLSRVPSSPLSHAAATELKFDIPSKWRHSRGRVPGVETGGDVTVIGAAAASLARRVANVDLKACWWSDFGSHHMKTKWRVSPDAASQMAMQCAVRSALSAGPTGKTFSPNIPISTSVVPLVLSRPSLRLTDVHDQI